MDKACLAGAVVVLILLAGCGGLTGPLDQPLGGDQHSDSDEIGWENGYWYDTPLNVTGEDGYNESERSAVLARTMARVEQIRQAEFDENISVEVVSRAAYRNRSGGLGVEQNRWNEQVWEGLLLIGEDRSIESAFGSTYSTSVQGYYSPDNGSIVLVSDSPTPTIDRTTLSHELVHALQDQHGNLDGSPPTQDRQLARQSVTEGEANYIQALYEQRCGVSWDCVPRPRGNGASGGQASDGVFLVIYQPYATGPLFIDRIRRNGGWDAIDALYANPPSSTEQVIHPDLYPDEQPVNVTVPDRSSAEWTRFDHDPVADTVGEASIYAMFSVHDATGDDTRQRYSYRSEPSAGWAGDTLVPYRNGTDGAGYVWKSQWDTELDATQFVDAYRSILDRRAAERPSEDVYVLPPSDPFGDAFRVSQNGTRVTIVNGPTRDALSEIDRILGGETVGDGR